MNVLVCCSGSPRLDAVYTEAAEALGAEIARRGHGLVYGGGALGLMGSVARAVHAGGGRVVGIIPGLLRAREGVAYDISDEFVVTETMAERKALMFARADAFVFLPGGIGTMEELFEALSLTGLGLHARPIALVNTGGFFDPLLAFLDRLREGGFIHGTGPWPFAVADTPEAALDAIDALA